MIVGGAIRAESSAPGEIRRSATRACFVGRTSRSRAGVEGATVSVKEIGWDGGIYPSEWIVGKSFDSATIVCPESGHLPQTEIAVDGAPPQWGLRPRQVETR